jgi:glycosyltransferase involved in cell wall biosynthesis
MNFAIMHGLTKKFLKTTIDWRMRKESTYPHSILIITHYFTTGPAVELRDFLKDKTSELIYISHPFSFAIGDKHSTIIFYKKGKKLQEKYFPYVFRNEILLFIKDFIASLYFIFRYSEPIELCIASDNLNTLAVLVLKKFGKVKKVIYYNVDYTPARFQNRMLNSIYHAIDRYCSYNADMNWVGTKKTTDARKKNGMIMKKVSRTIIVPDGNHAIELAKRTQKRRDKNIIVFVGHITKKQGLDLVIKSLPDLLTWNKKLRLVVIGTGDYEKYLKNLANSIKVAHAIEWKGLIESHKKVEDILLGSAIGLAPYVPDKDSFTNFSEAGKPKLYLGCGLPVILTKVPAISKNIEKNNAGKIVNYDTKSLISAVKEILENQHTYSIYQKNSQLLGQQFDWSSIFKKAFSDSLNAS